MYPSDESSEITTLNVPPKAQYARVVRMTAANIAMVAGMNVVDVDDVRMAAEEAFVYTCATHPQHDLHVTFTVTSDALVLDFMLGHDQVTEDACEPALVYSRYILDAMCDECSIGEGPDATLHLVKRLGEVDA